MAKFSIGDRVRALNTVDEKYMGGMKGTVKAIKESQPLTIGVEFDDDFGSGHNLNYAIETTRGRWGRPEDFEILSELKINNMIDSLKEGFVNLFLGEPKKTFRENGITNGDGFLTADGEAIFLAYLLEKNGEDFKTTVVDKMVEAKKDKASK